MVKCMGYGCAFNNERCVKTKIDMFVGLTKGLLTFSAMLASILIPGGGAAVVATIGWIKFGIQIA